LFRERLELKFPIFVSSGEVRLNTGLGKHLETFLAAREKTLLRRYDQPSVPPVFIVGLPRSGSTLLYQVLARGLRVSYLCNAAVRFGRAPAFVTTWLGKTKALAPPNRYESRYGETKGLLAPAQGSSVWSRWFREKQSYLTTAGVPPEAYTEMRATVACVEEAGGGPFINKAQGHSVRILPLCEAFPQALFVKIKRDYTQVAASILRGKREVFGDDSAWFSAQPSCYESLVGADPYGQIAGQIFGLENDMARDLAAVGHDRVLDVEYEGLCADPRGVIKRVADFYATKSGVEIDVRASVPRRFTASRGRELQRNDELLIRDALKVFGDGH
jgi:hypothetical protein